MRLSDLYNKELREQISKEEWDSFLSRYSGFMDEQLEEMKKPIFTQLFIDFQRMHSCLQMACQEDKDEIRQEYDKGFLLKEGARLYSKWANFVLDKAAKETMDYFKDNLDG